MSQNILPWNSPCYVCDYCPQPYLEWDSVSASKSKQGINAFTGIKVYLKKTLTHHSDAYQHVTGHNASQCGLSGCCAYHYTSGYDGAIDWIQVTDYDPVTGAPTTSGPSSTDVTGSSTGYSTVSSTGGECVLAAAGVSCSDGNHSTTTPGDYTGPVKLSCGATTTTVSSDGATQTVESHVPGGYTNPGMPYSSSTTCAGFTDGGTSVSDCNFVDTTVLSVEFTNAMLKDAVAAALPAFPDEWTGYHSSSFNLALNERSLSVNYGRYRWRFPMHQVRNGKVMKINWVERFLPDVTRDITTGLITGGGSSLTSITVHKAGRGYETGVIGSYVPTGGTGAANFYVLETGNGYPTAPVITVEEPPAGGTRAVVTANMLNGRINSLTIVNYGSGYKEPPIVTVAAPSGGTVPTLFIGANLNGGTDATGTVVLGADGAVSAVNLTNHGTRYTAAPFVNIYPSSPHGLGEGAEFHVHIGTETAKTYSWDGVRPSGYDPYDATTWPKSPASSPIPIPTTNGETLPALMTWSCI